MGQPSATTKQVQQTQDFFPLSDFTNPAKRSWDGGYQLDKSTQDLFTSGLLEVDFTKKEQVIILHKY